SLARRPAVAGVDRRPCSRNRGDHSGGRVNSANLEIEAIGDEEVARRIQHDSIGLIEPRLERRAAVTRVATHARTRDGAYLPGPAVDLANPMIEGVREKRIALGIEGDIKRLVQASLSGRSAVAAKALLACTGHCEDGGISESHEHENQLTNHRSLPG